MPRKFSGGEPFRVSHQDHNRWQDAGRWIAERGNGTGGAIELPDEQTGVILVQNTTALDLERFAVLGLGESFHNPNYDAQSLTNFKNQIVIKGEMPTSAHTGKFAVLLLPATAGEIVPALVSGVTAVRLLVDSTEHEYADAETDTDVDNRTRYLKTAGSGGAHILYRYEQAGEQWGVVRISNKPLQSGDWRIVRYDWLPAAYGGTWALGVSGAAASSNGNTNPTDRQIFPKFWTKAYEINSSGDIGELSETGYVVNLGHLPLNRGWGLATKLPYTHPGFGDVWAIIPDAMTHYAGASFEWITEESAGDWTFTDGEADLIRCNTGSAAGTSDKKNWVFPYGGDIMLSHTGVYEVTFGFRGYVDSSDYPYYDHSLITGTGTYRLPMGFSVQVGIHKNFEPGTSVVGTNPDASTMEMLQHFIAANDFASTSFTNDYQKTVFVEYDDEPWHGQHHTRLSPYIKVTLDPSASSAGTPMFKLTKFWMNVRPARYNGQSGMQDGYFAGANQYPGGYNNGSGTFVWYGGGDAPPFIDKDGAEI